MIPKWRQHGIGFGARWRIVKKTIRVSIGEIGFGTILALWVAGGWKLGQKWGEGGAKVVVKTEEEFVAQKRW